MKFCMNRQAVIFQSNIQFDQICILEDIEKNEMDIPTKSSDGYPIHKFELHY